MFQSLVVLLILAGAVAYLGRRWYRTFAASRAASGGGGGGCAGCSGGH
jgi:hypothetical protein